MTTIRRAELRYIKSIAGRFSKHTARTYNQALVVFNRYLTDEHDMPPTTSPTENLHAEHFIGFPDWALATESVYTHKRYSKSTLGVTAAAVKGFLESLVISGHILPSYQETLRMELAFDHIARKREYREPKRTYHENVVKMQQAVHAAPTASRGSSPEKIVKAIWLRDIALIEWLVSTGCRNEELTKLTVGDVDTVHGTAKIHGKGNKDRTVYPSREALDSIREYWQFVGLGRPNDPAFCREDKSKGFGHKAVTTQSVRNTVLRVQRAAGLEGMHPHYFRHEFGTELRRKGYDLSVIRDALGHSGTAVTERYAHVEDNEVRDAVRDVFDKEV
jgi:site-specific recombinase XerD